MRILAGLFGLLLIGALGGMIVVFLAVQHYGSDLPDYKQLADYQPPTTTRLHAGDGRLLAEFATENRVFVPIEAIPGRVTQAFLSAEDKGFYKHAGVDFFAVARAMFTNITNYGKGKRLVGASTITQQVAKNFLLSSEVSYTRKIKEAILAFRMERTFDKDRILELYMNEIFLGFRSYGVAAAALNYFNKSLDELSIAEAAYLAALPKAPNNYHPIRKREAALARRNWVISRLEADGHITAEEAETAQGEPLEVRPRNNIESVDGTFFAEEVRRELGQIYGEDQLYQGGLSVRTTLDPRLQKIAEKSLRDGLIAYDRRHGWRGPLTTFDLEDPAGWAAQLAAFETPVDARDWIPAVVLALEGKTAQIGFADKQQGVIPFAEAAWAQKWLKGQRFGAKPKKIGDVLAPGDVVLVEPVTETAKGEPYEAGTFALRQIPDVNGALVAIDPHTGRVLAMVGGYSYARSEFNRATQALRQPGSSFKPIVYLAGLDSGFTPATIIMDGPIVIDQGAGLGKWKPSNYSDKFYGPTAMRVGIEKSRNLMTVRLAQVVGMRKIAEYAAKFGVIDNMEPVLAMSLGAGETTLMRLTNAYAMMVNGGKRISPTLVDRVQDREGKTVFRHDVRSCDACHDGALAFKTTGFECYRCHGEKTP